MELEADFARAIGGVDVEHCAAKKENVGAGMTCEQKQPVQESCSGKTMSFYYILASLNQDELPF